LACSAWRQAPGALGLAPGAWTTPRRKFRGGPSEAVPAKAEAETEAVPAKAEAETEAVPAKAEAETEAVPAQAEAETEAVPAQAEAETEAVPVKAEAEAEAVLARWKASPSCAGRARTAVLALARIRVAGAASRPSWRLPCPFWRGLSWRGGIIGGFKTDTIFRRWCPGARTGARKAREGQGRPGKAKAGQDIGKAADGRLRPSLAFLAPCLQALYSLRRRASRKASAPSSPAMARKASSTCSTP